MSALKELTLRQFAAELASNSPAPGGGSVSALAGCLAASLLSMYCLLSADEGKYPDAVHMMRQAGEEARAIGASMLENVDRDTDAFNKVMQAFRLPRSSPAEKEARRDAIQKATMEAAQVPLETARGCLRLLELVSRVAGKGNPAAVTDLGVANLQAMAGLEGAIYNVKINLEAIDNREVKEDYAAGAEYMLAEGRRLWESNRQVIEQGI